MRASNPADSLAMVSAAIERVELARAERLRVHGDPAAGPAECAAADASVHCLENEFGWQWDNVKSIIEHFGKPALEEEAMVMLRKLWRNTIDFQRSIVAMQTPNYSTELRQQLATTLEEARAFIERVTGDQCV